MVRELNDLNPLDAKKVLDKKRYDSDLTSKENKFKEEYRQKQYPSNQGRKYEYKRQGTLEEKKDNVQRELSRRNQEQD